LQLPAFLVIRLILEKQTGEKEMIHTFYTIDFGEEKKVKVRQNN
jgi:hypothetical protein